MEVEFFEAKSIPAPSGGRKAFRVGDRQVVVEVHDSALRTRDGQMIPEKIRIAARAFLELQAERCGWESLPDELVLNSAAMDAVVNCLGWNPRFGSRVLS